MQASGAGPELTWRLRATQKQNSNQRKFLRGELEVGKRCITKALGVLLYSTLEALLAQEQMLFLELSGRALHNTGLEREHGVAARLLIAGVAKCVQRQRILIRRSHGFFHKTAEHACFIERQFDIQGIRPQSIGACGRLVRPDGVFKKPNVEAFPWRLDLLYHG